MKRIYFVRHGQTVGNLNRMFQTAETELTDAGHAGAKKVAERLTHLELDALVASSMTRAQQTAGHIAESTKLAVETFHDFHEQLQAEEVRGRSHDDPEVAHFVGGNSYYEHFAADEPVAAGFENFAVVLPRMQSCAAFLKAHAASNLVVVSHATYLRMFTSFLLMQEKEDKETNIMLARSFDNMSNAAITEFTWDGTKWELFTWNDNAHFAE